jgi:hypothetical protein
MPDSCSGRNAGFEAAGKCRLQRQRRDDGDQDWRCRSARRCRSACPGPGARRRDRGKRIGDRLTRVVMGMDAEVTSPGMPASAITCRRCRALRTAACRHWCRTARPSARRPRVRFGAGQRIVRVGLVAVEEMLAVDHRLLAGFTAASTDRGWRRGFPRWCSRARP